MQGKPSPSTSVFNRKSTHLQKKFKSKIPNVKDSICKPGTTKSKQQNYTAEFVGQQNYLPTDDTLSEKSRTPTSNRSYF